MTPDEARIMEDIGRRENDRQTKRIDEIYHIVTRTATQMEALVGQDLHTRVCELESAHRFWRGLVIFVPSLGGLIFAILKFFQSHQ